MSAMKMRPKVSGYSITPTLTCSVVKGYGAIFGRAAVKALVSVDLPAFG